MRKILQTEKSRAGLQNNCPGYRFLRATAVKIPAVFVTDSHVPVAAQEWFQFKKLDRILRKV